MSKKKRWIVAAVLIGCFSLTAVTEAQVQIFKKRASTALTEHDIQLTQGEGPWLIMCASFTGERGMQPALQLANELRNDHGLNAYIYRHVFDHQDKVQGSAWDVPDEQGAAPEFKKWRAAKADIYEKVAVVVGDYASVRDHSTVEALNTIKSLSPRSMMNSSYVDTEQSLEQQFRAAGRGPLSAAFLMPNPLLPESFFNNTTEVDETVRKMNKGVKYSLLKCRDQYTVRVATFTGKKQFNVSSADINKIRRQDEERRRNGSRVESDLMDGVYKANVLCRALRKKGVEAWEFHDRYESYVCVGGFDWATRKLEDGKDLLNPEIADVITKYKAVPQRTSHGTIMKRRTLAAFREYSINFDAQPIPILVPRASARTAKRGLFGR